MHTVSTCAGRGPDLQGLLCRDPGFAGRHFWDTISSVVRKANQVAPSSPAIASRVGTVLSRQEREALARREAAQSSTAPASHLSLRDAADLLDLESLPSGEKDTPFAGPAAEDSDYQVHLKGLLSGKGSCLPQVDANDSEELLSSLSQASALMLLLLSTAHAGARVPWLLQTEQVRSDVGTTGCLAKERLAFA